ncbi:putative actin patch assembly and actin polymerization protein [Mortierella hygrophila]|uniref:Actin patch assembly and actin polymerization protein n=1 Tax=Mortierella hygrophila TaxID=979708 RepID=A0A9P6FD66_9FUNG|nr:putative actin patch assembly and actin polymerization protein [Mortierella hygrophila]
MRIFPKETNITPQIEVLCDQPMFSSWSSLRLLCASVNSVDDGAKEASKALRKALRGDVPRRQMNAIIIIQGLVDGSHSRFLAQLATTKFAIDINYVASSKTANPQVKLCLMERLASWAHACSSDPSLILIPNLYNGLVYEQVVPFYYPNAPSQYPAIVSPLTSPTSSAPPSRAGSFNAVLTTNEILSHVEMAKNNSQMLTETVSFTDPDAATEDELSLIKEFFKKCMGLQRDTQTYLSDITSRPAFDEISLGQLLYANEDLVNAIKCHNDFTEKIHLKRALQRSTSTISVTTTTPAPTTTTTQVPISRDSSASPPTLPQQPTRTSSDEAHFKDLIDTDGAGVGSGYSNATSDYRGSSSSVTTGSGAPKGKTAVLYSSPPGSSIAAASASSEPSFDPFADDSHFVTHESDPNRVAVAIRNGKRPVLNSKEDPLTEQERDLIHLIKIQSLSEPERIETSNGTSSSSSSTAAAAAAAAIAAARPGAAGAASAPTTLQVATPVV